MSGLPRHGGRDPRGAGNGSVVVRRHPGPFGVGDLVVDTERVEQFLSATTELPDDAALDASLVRDDGRHTWDFGDLETLTTADDADPTWLRLRAAVNAFRQTGE
ncbi:hypothetical protein [Polymorphospora sp. NPDC050346]|uniref:hypothetical protein n=1 Tax=Polymorphospora sp. NPDC050346 TaxID=3155780 RepID=UPI0033F3DAAB